MEGYRGNYSKEDKLQEKLDKIADIIRQSTYRPNAAGNAYGSLKPEEVRVIHRIAEGK